MTLLAAMFHCFRTILRDLHNLTSITAEWRKAEAMSLSALVQKRIHHLQVSNFLLPPCSLFLMFTEIGVVEVLMMLM